MPEHDGEDQGKDSPKKAGSQWFARLCCLATSGANLLYPPGVWFADAMTSFSCVTFVLFCFALPCFAFFRLYAVVEAAALRSIVLRYAGAPVAPRVPFFFPFVYLEMSLFPSMFCTISAFSLHGERVCVCVFFLFILDIKFVGHASRGQTGGRPDRISHPPSFCGACLKFSREKDSVIPFPRRP